MFLFGQAPGGFENLDDLDRQAAAFFLSKCYRFGRGVPQDVAKADELQRAALEKGWDEAKSLEELLESLD